MKKSIEEFLSYLSDLDIDISDDGAHLRCSAPKGTLTPTLRAQLAERKEEILTFLSSSQPNHEQSEIRRHHNTSMAQNKQISQEYLSEKKQDILENLLTDGLDKNLSSNERKEKIKYFYDSINLNLESTIFASQSTFLNYGYVANDNPQYAAIELPKQTINKNRIKLVLEVIGDCNLTDCKILDIGCGRGGAIDVISKYFHAKEIIGIDLSSDAILFCQDNYSYSHAHFFEGDAEKLPFEKNKFDVVLNIESSHNYPDISAFFAEVYKVLKIDGYFLYTDFFTNEQVDKYLSILQDMGFLLEKNRDITTNVLLSLEESASIGVGAYDSKNDSQVVSHFLALPGSQLYANLENRTNIYKIFKFKKHTKY